MDLCRWFGRFDFQKLCKTHKFGVLCTSCEAPANQHVGGSQGNVDKLGSVGVMTNFPCSGAVKTGWPKFNAKKVYLGPLSSTCQCKYQHKPLHLSKATSKSTHAAACAEFLHALPRLPEEKGCLNMVKERGNQGSQTVRQGSC